MTNEEAIRVIEVTKAECEWNAPLDYQVALDMAIEALKEQSKHDQNTPQKQPDLDTLGAKTGETCEDVIGRYVMLSEVQTKLRKMPSDQSKQLKVLASVLDGCPLTQPCDKMWRGGWCEEHCKNNKLQEPNAECWLKYAEVMAADDT